MLIPPTPTLPRQVGGSKRVVRSDAAESLVRVGQRLENELVGFGRITWVVADQFFNTWILHRFHPKRQAPRRVRISAAATGMRHPSSNSTKTRRATASCAKTGA